ncbi:MAG: hypothetical protein U5R49_12985 [Deltaproteobacteria bacterium]|nr:hypothetical protein [Deltaproteobacteria bacterium]
MAQVVRQNYEKKRPVIQTAVEKLGRGEAWDDLRQSLADRVHSPQVLYDCLSGAGAAVCSEEINCDRGRLLSALLHAHEIRPRFTILDLAYITGIMPEAAQGIMDRCTGLAR